LHRASTGPRSMVGWTQQTWEADPRRLETDLGRCVEGLHWAAVAIEQRPAALELDRSGRELASTMVWKLRALTPDGRQAQLIAWSAEGRRIEARALVGRFGDEEKQQWLLDELQKVMAGPALRARHDKFSLPLMGP